VKQIIPNVDRIIGATRVLTAGGSICSCVQTLCKNVLALSIKAKLCLPYHPPVFNKYILKGNLSLRVTKYMYNIYSNSILMAKSENKKNEHVP
jgi:hypothetical protein